MEIKIGTEDCLYPMPIVLVEGSADGKLSYITIAHVLMMGFDSISLSMGKMH